MAYFVYLVITVAMATVTLGVVRTVWPLQNYTGKPDYTGDFVRSLLIVFLSLAWPLTLPLAALIGCVWYLSQFASKAAKNFMK